MLATSTLIQRIELKHDLSKQNSKFDTLKAIAFPRELPSWCAKTTK